MWREKLMQFFRRLALLLFWPGVALIAWGELTPNPPDMGGITIWDKAEHFTAYFGLAGMATLVLGLQPRLVLAILGVVALGGALEIGQMYTGRDAEWLDMLANTLGAFTGAALGILFLWLLRPRLLD